MKKIKLIGCAIFQQEIEYLLKQGNYPGLQIQWLDVGLHDNIERLEEELRAHIPPADGTDQTAVLFGHACLPHMRDLAGKLGFQHLDARNCLEAVVGAAGLKELEKNNTMVATPGWVRKMWLGRANTPLGWKTDDFRINFGRYELIVVLDPGIEPLTDEEIITCFDLVGVPIEVRPLSLDILQKKLNNIIEKFK